NFQYGVYIDNSANNTVGGTSPGARNVLSANGIDGVEIFGGLTQASSQRAKKAARGQGNSVVGNTIGLDILGRATFTNLGGTAIAAPDGPLIHLGTQLYGVVIIGSSRNSVGGKAAGAGNLIGGNIDVGVYITRRDFQNNIYTVPTGNLVAANMII